MSINALKKAFCYFDRSVAKWRNLKTNLFILK